MSTTGESKPKKSIIRSSKLVKKLKEQVKKLESTLKAQKVKTRVGRRKRTHRPSYWNNEVGKYAHQFIKDGAKPKNALADAAKTLSNRRRQRPLALSSRLLREEEDIGEVQRAEGAYAPPSRAEGQPRRGQTPKAKTPKPPLSMNNYRGEGEPGPSPYKSAKGSKPKGGYVKGPVDPPNLDDHNGNWRSALAEIEEAWREHGGKDDAEVVAGFRREGWIR